MGAELQTRATALATTATIIESVTGVDAFRLDTLDIDGKLDSEIPHNLRLGHMVERVVSTLIDNSSNYQIIYQGVQLVQDKVTLGELDYIIRDVDTKEVIHLELGYKFYLYDPAVSDDPVRRWIGPNRNDCLIDKLRKLRDRQFPLLYHPIAVQQLAGVDIDIVEQRLCLMGSLYVPYGYQGGDAVDNHQAVVGYYVTRDQFVDLHDSQSYYLPPKLMWGLSPADHTLWQDLPEVLPSIEDSLHQRRSVLCWQRSGHEFGQFFVVWW